MEEIWFFVVVDDRERRLAHATCEFMGMYSELMNILSKELYGEDWMRFSTFTQRDYEPDLHGELDIDVNDLPVMRTRFAPKIGLKVLGDMRALFIANEEEFIENEVVRRGDLTNIITDFNTAIDCLEKGEELGEKWFLDVVIESAG